MTVTAIPKGAAKRGNGAKKGNIATPVRRGTCQGCGEVFDDLSRTSPRSYCYACRPVKVVEKPMVEAPRRRRRSVELRPFTVEHFREWSGAKRMKDGSFFVLEDEWQTPFVADVFARESDGLPTFSELWLIVPEGNGKTTFIALLVLYVIEFTVEAWCPVAASARDQAVGLTYRIASGFADRNRLPYLLHPGYREIRHPASGGTMKIFASDAASGDGVDPVGVAVIEELHRLGGLELYETWSGKLDKSGAQLIVVSTAGEPGSPFEALRERLKSEAEQATVEREGCFTRAVSPGVVIHDYSLPAGADPDDIDLVALANPSPRKTVDALRRKRAKRSWNLAHWRRFTCNLPTRDLSSAITEAEWDALVSDERIPVDVPCAVGMDVAWKWDTTAIVPFWARSTEERFFGEARILTPPRDGTSLDRDLIIDALVGIHEVNPIEMVVMDMHRAEDIAQFCERELGAVVVDRPQTHSFAAIDYEMLLEGIRNRWIRHCGDREFRQHVLNAIVKLLPNGGARFDRPKESRMSDQEMRVIDALVAGGMVHSTVMRAADVPAPSAYEERGMSVA